jgi:hypothetical protein
VEEPSERMAGESNTRVTPASFPGPTLRLILMYRDEEE